MRRFGRTAGHWIDGRWMEVHVPNVHAAVPRPVRDAAETVLVHLPFGREHRGGETARVRLTYRGHDVIRQDPATALVVLDPVAFVPIDVDVDVVAGSVGVVGVVRRSAGSTHRDESRMGRDE